MTVVVYVIIAFYLFLVLNSMGAVMLDNRQPVKTIAWLLVILLIPIIGLLFYYFFGQNIRREFVLSKKSLDMLMQKVISHYVRQEKYDVPSCFHGLMLLMKRISFAYPFRGYNVKLYTDGNDFLLQLIKDISQARHHVHVEFFIIGDDEVGRLFADTLIDAVRRGVTVRLLYDDVGCWPVSRSYFRRLQSAGVQVQPFQPVHFRRLSHRVNYRNHRKIVVVDGMIGYVGGMNIALRYLRGENGGKWFDLHSRFEGSAVYGLQQLFLLDWYYAATEMINAQEYYPVLQPQETQGVQMQIVMSAPFEQWSNMHLAFNHIIQSANKYVYIQTPYFMPTETILESLQIAALRGVKVQLMVPLKPGGFWMTWANESFYGDVLKAGVEIFAYHPGMLHAKALVADDSFCSIGSANMDFRSLNDTFEDSAFFYDEEIAMRVKKIFEQARKDCMPITLSMWNSRNRRRRLLESFVRIFSPLF